MASTPNMDDLFKKTLEDIDSVQEFKDWHPPAGNYDTQLMKFERGSAVNSNDKVNYPWYKCSFKILSADGLERDTIKRFFWTADRPGRGFAMDEMFSLARVANKGQAITSFSQLEQVMKTAGDKQDLILNCEVRYEYNKKADKEYPRYDWRPVEG